MAYNEQNKRLRLNQNNVVYIMTFQTLTLLETNQIITKKSVGKLNRLYLLYVLKGAFSH